MTTEEKVYFTEKEALEDIKYTLDGYTGYYAELHDEVFNTDYYIIGTYLAKQALEQYGVFDAMEQIQTYEKGNFGEILTDLADPEKVANVLYYIIGNEVMASDQLSDALIEVWNDSANDETNKELIAIIDEMLADMD